MLGRFPIASPPIIGPGDLPGCFGERALGGMPPLNFKIMPGEARRSLEKYLFPYLRERPSPFDSPYQLAGPAGNQQAPARIGRHENSLIGV